MKTLLTAQAGTGKSTILQKVKDSLDIEMYGIVAKEIRDSDGKRVGFEAVNLEGESKVFMHVSDIVSDIVVGNKYRIDIDAINSFVVGEILKGKDKPNALVLIDEIGRAQSNSEVFMQTIRDIFPSNTNFLGTIVYDPEPWSLEFKNDEEVVLIVVTMENRDYLPKILTAVYNNLERYYRLLPAEQRYFRDRLRKYIQDGNYTMAYKLFNNTLKYLDEFRVKVKNLTLGYVVSGDHSRHNVDITDDGYSCDCDLYNKRGEYINEPGGICSHVEAVRVYRGEVEG